MSVPSKRNTAMVGQTTWEAMNTISEINAEWYIYCHGKAIQLLLRVGIIVIFASHEGDTTGSPSPRINLRVGIVVIFASHKGDTTGIPSPRMNATCTKRNTAKVDQTTWEEFSDYYYYNYHTVNVFRDICFLMCNFLFPLLLPLPLPL